ncbi:MAG TPA: GAP family protein [Solirubrobacterales bacterium]|nr:GAP family protein [Solirubrobacterales bacterium]
MSDPVQIFLLSLLAMFNPTLLAAVTLMLLLPNPKRLMLGYLLGAYTASIGVGLAIVFALHDSSFASTSRGTLSPLEDVVVGALLLLVAAVLATDRDRPLRERRERRRERKRERDGSEEEEEKEALPMRLLGRGSPRIAFVVGLLLSFPGVSYLTGLTHIHKLELAALPTALIVIAFCLVQQLLLELPLAGYFFAPERTEGAVRDFRAWLARNGRKAGIVVAAVLGALVLIRGIAGLVS